MGGTVQLLEGTKLQLRQKGARLHVLSRDAGIGLGEGDGSTDGTGAAAQFNIPYGITLGGGALYLADQSNNRIRKIQ